MFVARTKEEALRFFEKEAVIEVRETENRFIISLVRERYGRKEYPIVYVYKPLPTQVIKQVLHACGFPRVDVLDKLQETEAVKKIKKIERCGAVLSGPAGVGKSTAVCWWIAKQLSYYRIKHARRFSAFTFDFQEVRECYEDIDTIMIDDMNPSSLHQHRLDFLIELIYRAYDDNKKLFITTNEQKEKFVIRLPEAIVSRLVEMCEWIEVKGVDLRTRKRR